jgi:hypothetical protein
MLVLTSQGQPSQGSAWQAVHHLPMHGKKEIGKGLENKIKQDLGLK